MTGTISAWSRQHDKFEAMRILGEAGVSGTGMPAPVNLVQCSSCGDGVVDRAERCDNGNVASGDGCNSSCVADCTATPQNDCRQAPVSTLLIDDYADGSGDRLIWK